MRRRSDCVKYLLNIEMLNYSDANLLTFFNHTSKSVKDFTN